MEGFTDQEKKILEKYVSNTSKNIFVLKNLKEVIKGALFSRYSRSSLGLRELLLKEFVFNEEMKMDKITDLEDFSTDAIQKAQNFYDRILDGYGDDSIGELGGAHLAIENISMIAAKTIEDCRIGGSPLEKSTRYIYFNQKINGEYLFYKEPILMTSAYREEYLNTCNMLFDTYSKLIPPLTSLMEEKFPKEYHISKAAYRAALRAKVLDCLRGLLPASTLTNVGIFGNGRFFDELLRKLQIHNLAELQEIGKDAKEELFKIIPSFIRRSDPSHKYFQSCLQFREQMKNDLKILSEENDALIKEETLPGVSLVSYDADAVYKICATLLFEYSDHSLRSLENHVKTLSKEEMDRILDAACIFRENRRHKSPRALERAYFTFEIVADFGVYRDLQRHRMLTQERQLLGCSYGYFIPKEIQKTPLEKEYTEALELAKKSYEIIAKELREEAQYVVPMAYNMRFFFHVNLRALQWLCELRASPAGHPNYRFIAQDMVKKVCKKFPQLERFFNFVDFDGYDMGRINQEIRRESLKK